MKRASYFFIFFLLIILTFILGVRYGQKVEKTNKVIDTLLKITPTIAAVSPTPITYQEYKSKKWGIKYTFPSNLEVKESASAPAVLFQIKK